MSALLVSAASAEPARAGEGAPRPAGDAYLDSLFTTLGPFGGRFGLHTFAIAESVNFLGVGEEEEVWKGGLGLLGMCEGPGGLFPAVRFHGEAALSVPGNDRRLILDVDGLEPALLWQSGRSGGKRLVAGVGALLPTGYRHKRWGADLGLRLFDASASRPLFVSLLFGAHSWNLRRWPNSLRAALSGGWAFRLDESTAFGVEPGVSSSMESGIFVEHKVWMQVGVCRRFRRGCELGASLAIERGYRGEGTVVISIRLAFVG